jgi:hypothetical protein
MFGEINKKALEDSVKGSKNKIRLVKHNELMDFEEEHSDLKFRKSIIGR